MLMYNFLIWRQLYLNTIAQLLVCNKCFHLCKHARIWTELPSVNVRYAITSNQHVYTLRISTFRSIPTLFISLLLWHTTMTKLYHGGKALAWTHSMSTSVHWKIDTCYKCCCIRCQEGDSMSYFLYFTWSAESMSHLALLKELEQSRNTWRVI